MLAQHYSHYPIIGQSSFVIPQPTQPAGTTGQPVTPLGNIGTTTLSGQATTLPHAFTVGSLHDPTTGAWNMDTGASSQLNDSVTNLSEVFNSCMYPFVSVGNGHSIPVTNTGHSGPDES
ncbi:hypothetical protein Tco_1320061 [Tanacetum coccineum]